MAADRPPTLLTLRGTVLVVLVLNLGYFGVEFLAALHIGSVSLFADSVDFLEDAAVNFLIFVALGWTQRRRARVGMVLAAIMLLPAAAFVWMLIQKLFAPVPPRALELSLVGFGALVTNLLCALLLARHRHAEGSLTRAAFLSARNDAVANVAIVGAGVLTALHPTIWPDLIVGLAVAWMNLDAAREVWEEAREEHRTSGEPRA